MEIEKALKEMKKWRYAMIVFCSIFVIITFFLYIKIAADYGGSFFSTDLNHLKGFVYEFGCFWTCLALAVFIGVFALTVNKVHRVLVLVSERNLHIAGD